VVATLYFGSRLDLAGDGQVSAMSALLSTRPPPRSASTLPVRLDTNTEAVKVCRIHYRPEQELDRRADVSTGCAQNRSQLLLGCDRVIDGRIEAPTCPFVPQREIHAAGVEARQLPAPLLS